MVGVRARAKRLNNSVFAFNCTVSSLSTEDNSHADERARNEMSPEAFFEIEKWGSIASRCVRGGETLSFHSKEAVWVRAAEGYVKPFACRERFLDRQKNRIFKMIKGLKISDGTSCRIRVIRGEY